MANQDTRKPESLLEQTQAHLYAALVALKDAHQTAKASGLPHDQIDAAIRRAEIAWAIIDPFHGLDTDDTGKEFSR